MLLYVDLLRRSPCRLAVLGALVGRLPIGMLELGLALFVADQQGVRLASSALAVSALGVAVGAAGQGRLLDRHRPGRVLLPAAGVHVLALLVLVVFARQLPAGVVLALAGAVGLASPQLSGAMRSVWLATTTPGPHRQAALALEAITVELVFLVGPAVVAVLVLVASARLAVLSAGALALVGTSLFTWRASAFLVRADPSGGQRFRLPGRGALRLLASMGLSLGVTNGLLQIAVVAFEDTRHLPGFAGWSLSALSVASVASGLIYGARRWSPARSTRTAALSLVAAAAYLVGVLSSQPLALLGLAVLVGSTVTPLATEASILLAEHSPNQQANESFGWLLTAQTAGTALGAVAAGQLIHHGSLRAVFLLATAAAALGAIGLLGLRPPPQLDAP